MNKSIYSKLFTYKTLLEDKIFIDENLRKSVSDFLVSIKSLEDKNPESLIKLENSLDFYNKRSALILNNCKESLKKEYLDLFSKLQVYQVDIDKTPLFSNEFEEYIVLETIANVISLISEDRSFLIQPLIEKCKFSAFVKDAYNNILYINTKAAFAMNARVQDVQGKNCYETLSHFAKKYHEDDLKVIEQNKPLRNLKEEMRTLI
jgi:hypothetical protein